MALRVKPTQTRFPTNSLYTPIDNTPCILYKVCATRMSHPLELSGMLSLLYGHPLGRPRKTGFVDFPRQKPTHTHPHT